jgi:hypothetical protein
MNKASGKGYQPGTRSSYLSDIPVVVIPDGEGVHRHRDEFDRSADDEKNLDDLFISHAAEDKDSVVRPLVARLRELRMRVWYDEYSLSVGDSLSRSIDKGLVTCRFGLVVISPDFMRKPWTEYELRGLISREVGHDKLILPIWHNVTKEDVNEFSPSLADKIALNTAVSSLGEIALQLLAVVNPDHFAQLGRRIAYREWLNRQPVEWSDLNELRSDTPIIHETLPQEFLTRLRLVHQALLPVFKTSWTDTVNNFRKDHNATRELVLWERIAATFLTVVRRHSLTNEEARNLFGSLVAWSMTPQLGDKLDNEVPAWLADACELYRSDLPIDKEPFD